MDRRQQGKPSTGPPSSQRLHGGSLQRSRDGACGEGRRGQRQPIVGASISEAETSANALALRGKKRTPAVAAPTLRQWAHTTSNLPPPPPERQHGTGSKGGIEPPSQQVPNKNMTRKNGATKVWKGRWEWGAPQTTRRGSTSPHEPRERGNIDHKACTEVEGVPGPQSRQNKSGCFLFPCF